MTRQVPVDQPLSDEDRAYLHMRGQHDRVVQQDERFADKPDAEADDEEVDDYDSWTNAQLAAELDRRRLAKTGTKADMVDRLRADDVLQA